MALMVGLKLVYFLDRNLLYEPRKTHSSTLRGSRTPGKEPLLHINVSNSTVTTVRDEHMEVQDLYVYALTGSSYINNISYVDDRR